MFNWLKRLFGSQEVTLADKHAQASALGANALGFIHSLADDLDRAHQTLTEVADQAKTEAEALLNRGDAAVDEAKQHAAAASKIRSLVQ